MKYLDDVFYSKHLKIFKNEILIFLSLIAKCLGSQIILPIIRNISLKMQVSLTD